MRYEKRIVAMFLAVIMVCTLLPVSAFADFKAKVTITQNPEDITVNCGTRVTLTTGASAELEKGEYLYYIWVDADMVPVDEVVSIIEDAESLGDVGGWDLLLHFGRIDKMYKANPDVLKGVVDGTLEPDQPISTMSFTATETKRYQCFAIVYNIADMQDMLDYLKSIDVNSLSFETISKMTKLLNSKIYGMAVTEPVTVTVNHNTTLKNAKAATCTDSGYTGDLVCSRCGRTVQQGSEIAATGHSWGDWQLTTAPTCTENGVETRCCSVCPAIETRDVDAKGHDCIHHDAKAPTCTEIGWEAYDTCKRCDYTTYKEIAALDHDIEHHDAKAPTCTEIGWEAYDTCTRCDYSTYKELTELGHNYGEPVYEWNDDYTECVGMRFCQNDGCSDCFSEKGVVEKVVVKEPKCETVGELSVTASFTCKAFYTQQLKMEIPALSHEYTAVVTAPTCTEQGYTTYTCTHCGDSYVDDYVDALGHDFGEWSAQVESTCTVKGTDIRFCSRCDAIETRPVDALGHKTEIKNAKDATCTKDGYTGDKVCTVCGETVEKGKTIAKLGHSYTKKVVKPTASKQGYTLCTCSVCGYSYKTSYTIAAPTVKLSNVASTGKIKLTWGKIAGADKYYIYRSTDSGKTYKYVTSTTKLTYTDSKATAGKKYYYKVKAVKTGETKNTLSAYSTPHYLTCDLARPTVKITTSKGDPKLSWAKVSSATKYEVYRATSKTGTYSKYYTTTSTSYTNTSAVPGTTYYYKVKAIGANGNASDFSVIKSITCDCAQPVPTISTTASSGKPTLKWAAVDGATKYEIWRATSSTGTYSKYYTTTSTSYTNSSAVAGSTYYYKVKALCGKSSYGDSAFSAVKSITCDCAQPVVTISTTASSGKPTLKWSAVDGATKYEIWRATSKDGTYTKMYTTSNTSYANSSAVAGKTYYYKVKALCGKSSYGDSAFSAIKSITCDCARPVVSITTSSGHPKLSWKAVDGASKYEVYRATSSGGTYTKLGTTSNLSYTNTGAKAGTTYYYKVIAVCGASSYGNSAYSTVVSIKAK